MGGNEPCSRDLSGLGRDARYSRSWRRCRRAEPLASKLFRELTAVGSSSPRLRIASEQGNKNTADKIHP